MADGDAGGVSPGLNKVMLIGDLGRDPEMRYTPEGKAVTSFNLATVQQWTTSEGERRQTAEFFTVVAWGELAERCTRQLEQGTRVYVEGRLQTRSWEDAAGGRHFLAEVVAADVLPLRAAEPVTPTIDNTSD